MTRRAGHILGTSIAAFFVSSSGVWAQQPSAQAAISTSISGPQYDARIQSNADRMLAEGKKIFRTDTFGSEEFWGGQLRLHRAIVGEKLGGVGPGMSPNAALKLGLKVDSTALPSAVVSGIKSGTVNLDDPATTVTLLRLNAVIGVKGFFTQEGRFESIGIQCALCHSTVDDSFAPGIGRRLDGWANRDLNIGAIVASAPNLTPLSELLGVSVPIVRQVLLSWGSGRYDAELNADGKAFRPDGKTAATLIPSAFGLAGVNEHTWTGGWGTVTYWNAYVANTQMQGQGTFYDRRLDNATQYPVAAAAQSGHRKAKPDLITSKLPALHFYQLAMPAPRAPRSSINTELATRGRMLFNGQAKCATCHVPPIFTEPGNNLHKGSDIGIDDFQADRGPAKQYVTTPLRALFDTQKLHKGGFYHDGRFATLRQVVNHYDRHFTLGLTDQEKLELIEYLRSL
jgi:mono/diheme cytochrome c family protein